MTELSDAEVEQIGRDAAEDVAGAGAVLRVQVTPGLGSIDEPAYFFSFVIDPGLARPHPPGMLHLEIDGKIRDALIARGDETYPFLTIITPAEWNHRAHA
jgi:hypothetical protein